jgi:hypothetical protein
MVYFIYIGKIKKIDQCFGYFQGAWLPLRSTDVNDQWTALGIYSTIHKEQPWYFSLYLFEQYQPGYKGEILGNLCYSTSELVETRLSSS